MSSKISAALVISGDSLDFEECTKAVGVHPSRVFERTYDYDSELVPAKQWCLAAEKIELESVDDAVVGLLKLVPSRERLFQFSEASAYDFEVACTIDVYEDRPLYELSKETIENLFHMKAGFSMEVHDYTDD